MVLKIFRYCEFWTCLGTSIILENFLLTKSNSFFYGYIKATHNTLDNACGDDTWHFYRSDVSVPSKATQP